MPQILIFGRNKPDGDSPELLEALAGIREDIQHKVAGVLERDVKPEDVIVRYMSEDPPPPLECSIFVLIILDHKQGRTPEILKLTRAVVKGVLSNTLPIRECVVRHIFTESYE